MRLQPTAVGRPEGDSLLELAVADLQRRLAADPADWRPCFSTCSVQPRCYGQLEKMVMNRPKQTAPVLRTSIMQAIQLGQ
jgi:hypothetical protein